MSKNSYDVSYPRMGSFSRRKRDSSFSSCLCTMLVILGICLLLLLLSYTVKKMATKKEYQTKKFERIVGNTSTSTETTSERTTRIDGVNIPEYERNTENIISTTDNEEINNIMSRKDTITVINTEVEETSSKTTQQITSTQPDTTPFGLPDPTTQEPSSTTDSPPERTDPTNDDGDIDRVGTQSDTTPFELSTDPTTQEPTSTTDSSSIRTVPTRTEEPTTTDSSFERTVTTNEEGDRDRVSNGISTLEETSPTITTQDTMTPSTPSDTILSENDVTTTLEPSSTIGGVSEDSNIVFDSIYSKDKDTCTKRTCNLMAARIISSMDPSEKSCNDFYNYACGGILVTEIEEIDIFKPELLGKDSPKFLKIFDDFYQSCKNYEDAFRYKDRISALFNILQKHFYERGDGEYGIEEMLANLMLLEAFPYLRIDIDVHPKNSSTFILAFRKPKYKPSSSEYWSSFSEFRRKCLRKSSENMNASTLNVVELYNEYQGCFFNYTDYSSTFESLKMEMNLHFDLNQTEREIKEEVANLIESMIRLNVHTTEPTDEITNVGKLQEKYPEFNWTTFLSLISNEDVHQDTDILTCQHFNLVISNFLRIDERRILESALAEYIIYENIVLQSHVESRTEFCKKQTKYLMPDISNYLYKITPNPKFINRSEYVRKIFGHFKKQFNESLEENDWIDDDSRIRMMERLDGIKLSLFETEDNLEEQTILEKIYTSSIRENDYPSNLINLMKHKNKQKFSLQGQEVTADKVHRYLLDTTEEEPLYINENTVAYVPYGLIDKASEELPSYVVMAQVGFPLAKIIGKTFWPTRIKNDMKNETTREKFNYFVHRMKWSSRKFSFNNQSLSWQKSPHSYVDELVAENTALRLLTDRKETFGRESLMPWLSYQFSREKIFFLVLTQEFCRKKEVMDIVIETVQNQVLPPPLRSNNVLSNSEEFMKHFSCDENSSRGTLQFPYIKTNQEISDEINEL